MPKLSNPTAKQKVEMLDNRYRPYIKSIGYCEAETTGQTLDWSHIIGRTYIKTRWDPRNTQAIGHNIHGVWTDNPILFTRWVENSSCGKYMDTMQVQAYSIAKPDYELWFKIYEIITERNYTVEESREWLGQNIMLNIYDLSKLD